MEVKIITSDKVEFLVPADVASKSGVVKSMIDMVDGEDRATVPLQDICSRTFGRVLEYLRTDVFQAPDSHGELLEVVVAANFLDVKPLLDAACPEVADRIKGKTPEAIREIFGLENAWTPAEEAQVRQANAWAYE